MHSRARSAPHLAVLAVALGLLGAGAPAAPDLPRFKLFLREAGVYRVTYEDLAPDLAGRRPETAALGLRNAGEAVAVWIAGGDDGSLDPGDSIEFLGRHLPGENAYYNELTRDNVYVLAFDDPEPARMRSVAPPPGAARSASPGAWTVERHQEEDRMLMRFAATPGRDTELWYWAKLSHLAADAFRLPLDLPGLDTTSSRPVTLRIRLRGLSEPRHRLDPNLRDHRVEAAIDGRPVGAAEWDGAQDYVLEIDAGPARALAEHGHELALVVPARVPSGAIPPDPVVDVSLLNSVALRYPRSAAVGDSTTRLRWDPASPGDALELLAAPDRRLVIYTDGGERLVPGTSVAGPQPSGQVARLFAPPAGGAQSLFVVPDGALRGPDAIEVDRPSALRLAANRADYIMIVHPRLRDAIEPLAALHRRRGLTVEVVDIRDVYDEFHHGILHPRAIRDFVAHAHRHWRRPAPRFVLLVGDASWDSRNEQVEPANYASWTWNPAHGTRIPFGHRTPYSRDSDVNHRNLIPTWSVATTQGHAASDNWFVAVDGDDIHPDLAIGRLPVVSPEEVEAIVAKTIRYVEEPEVGPWRRNLLWITDENTAIQDQSDWIVEPLRGLGFRAVKVYPDLEEVANETHQARLRQALGDGQLLVHFWGHGGRFIWQTGRTDLNSQRDLFNLDDLDRLPASRRLAVVLSMTCYSGPFDHPNADSLGEKFLRLPDAGAVAVLAASWRSAPTREFSHALVEELLSADSIGTAVLRAKHRITDPAELIEIYNLLGDPAIPLAMPRLGVRLAQRHEGPHGLSLVGTVERAGFSGRALVEWLDGAGRVVAERQLALDGPSFAAAWEPPSGGGAVAVRVYVWNAEEGIDGIGAVSLAGGAR